MDRSAKALIYAQAGILELWLGNVAKKELEVLRVPTTAGYLDQSFYSAGQSVEPLFAPGTPIPVGEIVP